MITLTGMYSALRNGESTVEEMFQRKADPAKGGGAGLGNRLDKLASAGKGETVDPDTGEITDAPASATKTEKARETSTDAPDKAEVKPRAKRAEKAASGKEDAGAAQVAQPTVEAAQPAQESGEAASEDDSGEEADDNQEDAVEADTADEEDNSPFGRGRAAAAEGFSAFKKWRNKLTQKEYEEVSPQLKQLEAMARQVDA